MHTRSLVVVAVLVLALVTAPATAVVHLESQQPALEAQTNGVTISYAPGDVRIQPNQTVQLNLIVAGASNGISAYDLSIGVDNSSVASITDISFAAVNGTSGFTSVNISANHTSARVTTYGANYSDGGNVTLLTVTVEGKATGETSLTTSIRQLRDESSPVAQAYSVQTTTPAIVEVAPQVVTAHLSPASDTVGVNSTTTFELIAGPLTNGVSTYNISVAIHNATVGQITNVSFPTARADPGTPTVTRSADGSTAIITTYGADYPNTGNVTLFSISVIGDAIGNTTISLTVQTLRDESTPVSKEYQVQNGGPSQLMVQQTTAPPQVPGAAGPPTDPVSNDYLGGGNESESSSPPELYEDVTGDGVLNVNDVNTLYYVVMNGGVPSITNNAEHYNFDGRTRDGQVLTVSDVNTLFNLIEYQGNSTA